MKHTHGFRKLAVVLAAACLAAGAAWAQGNDDAITREQVVAIVDMAAEAIAADAPGTFVKITSSEHPFVDQQNPALYVFVYDTDVNMMAHPNKSLPGRNYKGKPDVRGKAFRDEIVSGAVANGTGWVDYAYQKPGEAGIFDKTTYYRLTKGSDGKDYVVTSGMYKSK